MYISFIYIWQQNCSIYPCIISAYFGSMINIEIMLRMTDISELSNCACSPSIILSSYISDALSYIYIYLYFDEF